MKIISKFKDYYDIALAYGVDDNIVYTRLESESVNSMLSGIVSQIFNAMPSSSYVDTTISRKFIIGFCGKLFPGLELQYESLQVKLAKMCYLEKDIRDFERKVAKLTKSKKTSRHKPKRMESLNESFYAYESKEVLQSFFDLSTPLYVIKNVSRMPGQWHLSVCEFTINSKLKNYGFAKVFDSYSAYQEIEMFLGGVLGNKEIDTVGIDDEHLKLQKGFDKWSFKKMPTKKKKK